MKWRYRVLTLVILLLLAACTSQATEQPETAVTTSENVPDSDEAMSEEMEMADDGDEVMADDGIEHDDAAMDDDDDDMDHDDSMTTDEDASEMMGDEDESMDKEVMESDASANNMDALPTWQTIALTNVRTGQSFTIADFAGKTVYVEPMATWCTNCRRQLGNVQEAHAQLNSEDVVFIGISVETNIDDATLASYTEDLGFDWPFAVATPEMLQSLAEQFGRTISNPPATPHFIIYPDGTTTELATGFETADELIAQLQ